MKAIVKMYDKLDRVARETTIRGTDLISRINDEIMGEIERFSLDGDNVLTEEAATEKSNIRRITIAFDNKKCAYPGCTNYEKGAKKHCCFACAADHEDSKLLRKRRK